MEEIWMDVVGYEGIYKVSNTARVISLERMVKHHGGFKRKIKSCELHKSLNNDGYFMTGLHKNAQTKTTTIHRLVATAFIPNPNNYETINHIDGNKINNNVENLEWMSQVDNVRHSWEIGSSTCHTFGRCNEKHPRSKIVYQYSINGDFIRDFPSVSEAARVVGGNRGNISIVSLYHSKEKTIYGYRWSYEKLDNLFINL